MGPGIKTKGTLACKDIIVMSDNDKSQFVNNGD